MTTSQANKAYIIEKWRLDSIPMPHSYADISGLLIHAMFLYAYFQDQMISFL